jgi:hypothetical protein
MVGDLYSIFAVYNLGVEDGDGVASFLGSACWPLHKSTGIRVCSEAVAGNTSAKKKSLSDSFEAREKAEKTNV